MDPNQPNLDVYQMQDELQAQSMGYMPPPPGGYGDGQANLTEYRASYGDVPAMMMTGASYAGAAGYGAVTGLGNMFSQVGSRIMPVRYTPPARVNVGYYGQYQQETSFLRGLATTAGMRFAPQGTSNYKYGYYGSADFGERLGGGIVSAGVVAGATATGMPVGAGIGSFLGGIMGAPLGPVGAAVGAGIGSLAGGLMGYTGVEKVADIVAQRRQMNAFLESSSFRYVGAGSEMADPRLGGGMSAAARRETTDFMRRMDIKDPNLNMDDLFGVLQGATASGLLTGVRDIEGFKTKFKDIVEGVKAVSKTLQVSLQEGLQVMKDLKAINIEPSQMATIGFQADVAGRVSGRTAQEVIGLGLQGAELFRGTGFEMKIGYQSNVMNIASIRSARDAGLLSQEAIVQAGGEEALAQRMTASGLQFMQSAAGRGFGGAFFNPGMGATGFNRGAFMDFMGKGGSMVGLAMQSAANLSSSDRVIQYEAYQDKYMSEMGKALGGDTTLMVGMAAMSEARMLYDAGATKDMKAAFRLTLMKSYGMSPAEADTMYARIQNAPQEFKSRMEAGQTAATQRTVDEAMSTVGFGYLQRRAEDALKKVAEPFVRLSEDVIEGTREGAIKMWEKNVVGIQRADLGGLPLAGAANLARAAGASEAGSFSNLDDRLSPTTKAAIIAGGSALGYGASALAFSGPVGWIAAAGVTGAAAVAIGVTSWSPTTGKMVKENVQKLSTTYVSLKDKVRTGVDRSKVGSNDVILEDNPLSSTVTVIDSKELARANSLQDVMTASEAAKLTEGGKGVTPAGMALEAIADSGADIKAIGLEGVAQRMFKKSFENLSAGEMATLVGQSEELAKVGFTETRDLLSETRKTLAGQARLRGEEDTKKGVEAYGVLEGAAGRIADRIQGVSKEAFTPRVAALLTAARYAEKPEERARYLKQATEAYYASGKVKASGAATKSLFSRLIDPTRSREVDEFGVFATESKTIAGSLKSLEEVQIARGLGVTSGMLAQELADPEFVGDKEKIRSLYDRVAAKGLEAGLSSEDKKLLSSTTAGKTILQAEEIAKKLDEADKSLPVNASSADRRKAADTVLKEMTLNTSVKSQVMDNYAEKGTAHTRQMLTGILAQNLPGEKITSGPRAGTGTPEAMGTEQGTGAAKESLQMNINVQVLSALNALATQLGARKGS